MEKERFQAELQAKTKEIEALLTRYLPEEKGYQKTVLETMNYSLMEETASHDDAGNIPAFRRQWNCDRAVYGSH